MVGDLIKTNIYVDRIVSAVGLCISNLSMSKGLALNKTK